MGDPSASTEDELRDDVSLAPTDATTSGGTFMTRYTNRSNGTINTQTTRRASKNKRREERKRARGKKGSVYEEEYLVNSLGRLIERLNGVNEDVGRLVEGLMKRQMRERARAIEDAMVEVIDKCNSVLEEVFGTDKSKLGGLERAAGGDAVLQDAIESTSIPKVSPVIKAFDRLVVVG